LPPVLSQGLDVLFPSPKILEVCLLFFSSFFLLLTTLVSFNRPVQKVEGVCTGHILCAVVAFLFHRLTFFFSISDRLFPTFSPPFACFWIRNSPLSLRKAFTPFSPIGVQPSPLLLLTLDSLFLLVRSSSPPFLAALAALTAISRVGRWCRRRFIASLCPFASHEFLWRCSPWYTDTSVFSVCTVRSWTEDPPIRNSGKGCFCPFFQAHADRSIPSSFLVCSLPHFLLPPLLLPPDQNSSVYLLIGPVRELK